MLHVEIIVTLTLVLEIPAVSAGSAFKLFLLVLISAFTSTTFACEVIEVAKIIVTISLFIWALVRHTLTLRIRHIFGADTCRVDT